MSTHAYIAGLLALMVNAVLFGAGAIAVLSIPELSERAAYLLPVVIVASFAISPFISWYLAPRLRSRWQRRHAFERGI